MSAVEGLLEAVVVVGVPTLAALCVVIVLGILGTHKDSP